MNSYSSVVGIIPKFGNVNTSKNQRKPSSTTGSIIPYIAPQDTVRFSGGSVAFSAVREAAKTEAQQNNKSLINWGKMGVKFAFRTVFEIAKNL